MVVNWVQRRGSDRDIERRTRQLKEIVRLGYELRAEIELDRILGQVVEGITSTLGFRAAVLNLIHPDQTVEVAATSGLSEAERKVLQQSPPLLARLLAVMRPEFCVSHSYFISHEYKHLLDGLEVVSLYSPASSSPQRGADAWHPDDALFVPLLSPHKDRLLGIISLDQPEDGKIPSLETIEMIEMFSGQAALAIETSYLFQERETERKALEGQLFELLYQLEQVRQGDLGVHFQLSGETLAPMVNSLNVVFQALGGLLRTLAERVKWLAPAPARAAMPPLVWPSTHSIRPNKSSRSQERSVTWRVVCRRLPAWPTMPRRSLRKAYG